MTTNSNGRKVNVTKGKQGFQETVKAEPTPMALSDREADAVIEAFNEVVDGAAFLEERTQRSIDGKALWLKEQIAKPVDEISTSGIAEMACKMAREKGAQRVYRVFLHDVREREKTTREALLHVTGWVTQPPSNSTDLAYRADSLANHEGALEAFAELSKMVGKQEATVKKAMEDES